MDSLVCVLFLPAWLCVMLSVTAECHRESVGVVGGCWRHNYETHFQQQQQQQNGLSESGCTLLVTATDEGDLLGAVKGAPLVRAVF